MAEYIFLLILFLVAVGFVAFMLLTNRLLNWLAGPKSKTSAVKQEPFECGSPPFHQPSDRVFHIKYSTLAILFVMFDLETILLYPWAVGAREAGGGAILAGAVFLFVLTFALVYIWRKGLLNWQ